MNEISIYNLIIVFGIILSFISIAILANKKERLEDQILTFFVLELIGIVLGSKLFTFLTNLEKYNYKFDILNTGSSSIGAVVGMLLMGLIYSMIYKEKIKSIIEYTLPSIPIMYSIGKIACHVEGCCYGIKYKGPLSIINYHTTDKLIGVKVFPIQALEAIVFGIISIYIFNKLYKNEITNKIIGQSLIMIFLSKLLLDFLRFTHETELISINQIACIPFILIGIYLIKKK